MTNLRYSTQTISKEDIANVSKDNKYTNNVLVFSVISYPQILRLNGTPQKNV